MAHDRELDLSAFRIPWRAWIVAAGFAAIAALLVFLVPGPIATGCLHSKTCNVAAEAPLLLALASLVLGAGVSTWVGAIPRQWVVGWCAALAGIAVPMLATSIVLLRPDSLASSGNPARTVAIAVVLCLGIVWVVQIPVALIATMIPSPCGPQYATTATLHDDRPRWLREIDAVLAVISADRGRWLAASESQLVAELVFTLEKDPEAPVPVLQHVASLRSLLSLERQRDPRRTVCAALALAATARCDVGPYRDRV